MASSAWFAFWALQVLAKSDPEVGLLWLLGLGVALIVDLALWCPPPKRRRRQ